MTTPENAPTSELVEGGQRGLPTDDVAAAAPTPALQPGGHRTAVLALQARVAELDAMAAADVYLLAAVHEIEQLLEILKDRTVHGVQAAGVKNEVIGAALGVTKQAISKRWPRSDKLKTGDRQTADGRAGRRGAAAGAASRPAATKLGRARSGDGDQPWSERLAVRLLPSVRGLPTLHLKVTHSPEGRNLRQ
jgi:hypothetical protein